MNDPITLKELALLAEECGLGTYSTTTNEFYASGRPGDDLLPELARFAARLVAELVARKAT